MRKPGLADRVERVTNSIGNPNRKSRVERFRNKLEICIDEQYWIAIVIDTGPHSRRLET